MTDQPAMTEQPVRTAAVYVQGRKAGLLEEFAGARFRFRYQEDYDGAPVSLTMPVEQREFDYDRFPPFFDGLLPEGWQLEALLRSAKLDRRDYMGQLLAVGSDTVGAVTVAPAGSDTDGTAEDPRP